MGNNGRWLFGFEVGSQTTPMGGCGVPIGVIMSSLLDELDVNFGLKIIGNRKIFYILWRNGIGIGPLLRRTTDLEIVQHLLLAPSAQPQNSGDGRLTSKTYCTPSPDPYRRKKLQFCSRLPTLITTLLRQHPLEDVLEDTRKHIRTPISPHLPLVGLLEKASSTLPEQGAHGTTGVVGTAPVH
ncbi:hypothetical protein PLICRDRAFT_29815 [Plicaturopsis crispa FD-325 SS-3]|nr:hypothetical protein PLICRDRAFT_29815 [Plicaturopsis crispa FD-325 SS-3]